MTNNVPVVYRMMDASDHAFVYNSFLKSYRDSPMVRGVPNTIYFAKQHDLIELILTSPTSQAVVACNPTDPTQIYGYLLGQAFPAIHEGSQAIAIGLHWVYVKQPFRNLGIAKTLYEKFMTLPGEVPTSAVYFTHRVKTTERLLQSLPHLIFNPYLV